MDNIKKLKTKIILLEEKNRMLEIRSEALLAQFERVNSINKSNNDLLRKITNIIKGSRFGRIIKIKLLLK